MDLNSTLTLRTAAGALAVLALCGAAGAGENGTHGGPLPVNEWVKLEEWGLGPREGATLVYCRSIKRFLVAMGQQARYKQESTPYSEMTFNFEKRRWENALPKGGEGWGGVTGPVNAPVNAPTFWSGPGYQASDMRRGKDGSLRPYLHGGYGSHVFHLFAYDFDRERVFYGADIEYDPVARVWTKLKTQGHPGTPDLPPLKLDKPVEPCWSQSCYDPVNKEILLFGGTKVQTETASPGTWVYSPAKNEWRKLSLGSEELNRLAATAEALQKKAHVAVTACRNRYYRTELAKNAGKKPPDLLAGRGGAGNSWVEGTEWLYGGVGFSGDTAYGSLQCGCPNMRAALDYFRRTFAPETQHCSVAVLDANGNLIMRIGKYGNVDDGVPLVKEGGPPKPRSVGGDEVALFYAPFVATHTDRRLFIADSGNQRLLSVKLGYRAEERVNLNGKGGSQ